MKAVCSEVQSGNLGALFPLGGAVTLQTGKTEGLPDCVKLKINQICKNDKRRSF